MVTFLIMESSFWTELNTIIECFPTQTALLNSEDMWGQGSPWCPLQLQIYQVPAFAQQPCLLAFIFNVVMKKKKKSVFTYTAH